MVHEFDQDDDYETDTSEGAESSASDYTSVSSGAREDDDGEYDASDGDGGEGSDLVEDGFA